MSQALGVLDLTFKAGEDLSEKRYYFVYLSDDHTVSLCASGHVNAIGVLQNNPKSGEEALVRVLGTSKVVSGTPISAGDRVVSDVNGKADKEAALSGTEQIALGIALEDAAAGDVFEILLIQSSLAK